MTDHRIRSGSLQFWPRKRAKKILPSVNWNAVKSESKINGFIGYKVGMISVYAKDNTADSMTKNKKIIIPTTILECPKMKIYSVRLYKNNKVLQDVIVGFDKELKRKLKKPKQIKDITKELEKIKQEYDDIRVIVHSDVKSTAIKKTPDLIELGLGGSREDKLSFIKEKIGKEISISEVFNKTDGENITIDVRGVTKGFGTQGPVKRFGITLKSYKSEKGRRRPGSIGPWHPARVTFRVPMAGQTGFHTRVEYNKQILKVGNVKENDINREQGFHRFGKIKTDYILIRGSVPGPNKRVLLLTPAIRPTKKQTKQKYEVLELR